MIIAIRRVHYWISTFFSFAVIPGANNCRIKWHEFFIQSIDDLYRAPWAIGQSSAFCRTYTIFIIFFNYDRVFCFRVYFFSLFDCLFLVASQTPSQIVAATERLFFQKPGKGPKHMQYELSTYIILPDWLIVMYIVFIYWLIDFVFHNCYRMCSSVW